MLEKVIQLLEANRWKYQLEDDRSTVIFGIQANFGTIDCYIRIMEETGLFTMISFCMFEIDDDKVDNFNEFTRYVNFGLFTGCFEFDEAKKQMRFRTNFFFDKENLPSLKLLHRSIMSHLLTIDNYFPAMMSLLFTDMTPEEALKEVEKMPLLSLN